jgi:hypothetical protein
LFARYEKRGTGQNADVFLHKLERHIGLIDQSQQAQFLERAEWLFETQMARRED